MRPKRRRKAPDKAGPPARRKRTIPKREDERNLNMSGRHPAYCTCQGCTDKFLKRNKIKPGRRARAAPERVKPHPANCACATCRLLSSVGDLPALERREERERKERRKGGLLSRLLRRGG